MTASSRTPVDAVVTERSVEAPAGLVWQMWTDPDHFRAWHGPTGASVPVADMDVRVGGRRPVCMEVGPADAPTQMWFVGEYLEQDATWQLLTTRAGSSLRRPCRPR